MKKSIIITTVMAFFFAIGLQAQSCPAPTPMDQKTLIGEWKGQYTYNGEIHPITIKISEKAGTLHASTSLSSLKVKTNNFETWLCESNELHMRLDMPDNRIVKLIGSPSDGKISGRLVYHPDTNDTGEREVFTVKKNSIF